MPSSPIRLARPGESGRPFHELLKEIAPLDWQKIETYVSQWEHLRDELQASPTSVQYRERWPGYSWKPEEEV